MVFLPLVLCFFSANQGPPALLHILRNLTGATTVVSAYNMIPLPKKRALLAVARVRVLGADQKRTLGTRTTLTALAHQVSC